MGKPASLFAPIFTVRLKPEYDGDGIRELRQFLKAALRLYGLRALRVTSEEFEIPSPRPCRKPRRRTRFGKIHHQENEMDKHDLQRLKSYAAASRSPVSFAGTIFLKFDWKAGKWLAGKSAMDFTNKKLVADLPDIMTGFQRLEAGKKPEYALTKILDASATPIERAELGETNPAHWLNADKDPWTGTTVLPFFEEDTRAVYIFTATYGARGAVSNLLDAFVDHANACSDKADQLPLVSVGSGRACLEIEQFSQQLQHTLLGPIAPSCS
jgi:hypothetical protein